MTHELDDSERTTIMITECPRVGADTSQEQFIYRIANELAAQLNPLGIPLIDYPVWLTEGTGHVGMVQAEIRKQKRQQ